MARVGPKRRKIIIIIIIIAATKQMQYLSSQAGRRDNLWLAPWQGKDLFIYIPEVCESALGPTQSPTQLVSGVKRMGRETDHSPPSSTAVKNKLICNSTPSCHTLNNFTFCVLIIFMSVHRPRELTPGT